jgi:hypothetical protein
MKRLRLDVDALEVTSFSTLGVRGGVVAHESGGNCDTLYVCPTQPGLLTCDECQPYTEPCTQQGCLTEYTRCDCLSADLAQSCVDTCAPC